MARTGKLFTSLILEEEITANKDLMNKINIKRTIIVGCISLLTLPVIAQSGIDKNEAVKTIDGTIEALYASISGEKGEPRDWELFQHLFTEDARLIPTSEHPDGSNTIRTLSPEQYKTNSEPWLVENGFYEYETNKVVQKYGRIVHVFSTYGSKRSKTDTEPFMSGINSIQLFNDSERWWVVSVYWAANSERNPIPTEYRGSLK